MPQFNEQKSPLSQFKMGQNQVSWRHQQVEISGHGLKTIHFMDTTPNLFMIQNPTSATLYIGITNIPTENSYEWKVSPNSSKTFGRPIATDELYILNKTNVDCVVNLFSVYDRFDLSLLADMTVSLDQSIADEIKGDGIIKGFGAGVTLPKGTNHIGEVSIDRAGTTLINTIVANFGTLLKKSNVTNSVNLYDINETLKALTTAITGATNVTSVISKEQSGTHNMSFTDGGQSLKIQYFTNDSENNIEIKWSEFGSTTERQITVKGGETLTDIELYKVTLMEIGCYDKNDQWRFCYAKIGG